MFSSAFLLLGGSATEAVADPGRSHSDRGNSSDRGNGNGNGNSRGGSDRGDDDRRGKDNSRKRGEDEGDVSAERASLQSPEVQFGSGPVDLDDIAELAPSLAAGKSGNGDGSSDPGSALVDVADVADLVPSISAGSGELRSSGPGASVFGGSGAAGSPDPSGSYRADVPSARFSPPPLTLGNGRTPGIRRGESAPRLQAPVPQPPPAAPPPARPLQTPAPPPSWMVNWLPATPVLTQQLGVAPATDWSNPLWGLAGLLLIPVAGAALGYRQARAAHAAERLRRS